MRFPKNNTRQKLIEIVNVIEKSDCKIIVFGGWAAELIGIEKSRPHSDIDLILLDQNFKKLVDLAGGLGWKIIKSYSHKKAFLVDGIVVEVFLAFSEGGEVITKFIGTKTIEFEWPVNLYSEKLVDGSTLRLASTTAMNQYREDHDRIHLNSPWK